MRVDEYISMYVHQGYHHYHPISPVMFTYTYICQPHHHHYTTTHPPLLQDVAEKPFATVTYTQAVHMLQSSGQKFEYPVEWGTDLQSEHERYLTEVLFDKTPLIVTDYPKDIKAFYMRLNDDGKTVAAMDVLVPGVGELIGGSQREERIEVLEKRMQECGLSPEDYWWYDDDVGWGLVRGDARVVEHLCNKDYVQSHQALVHTKIVTAITSTGTWTCGDMDQCPMLGLDWGLSAWCCLQLGWKIFEMQFRFHDIQEIVIFRRVVTTRVLLFVGKRKGARENKTTQTRSNKMAAKYIVLLAMLALYARAEGLDKPQISGVSGGLKHRMGAVLLNTWNPLKNVAAAGEKNGMSSVQCLVCVFVQRCVGSMR